MTPHRGAILRLLSVAVAFAILFSALVATCHAQGASPASSAADAADAVAEAEEEERTGTIIGIDLGTTYSCVGVFHNGKVDIITNDQGNRITPSYVAFTDASADSGGADSGAGAAADADADRLVGDAAKNQATINPENTIFDVKRLIGRRYSDDSVQADKKLMPYKIVNVDGKPYVSVKRGGGSSTISKFAPEEISAMVLQKLKIESERYLGRSITRAVVTVPAYFNDAQRHATKDAGVIAGLHVERIINEPTAAAIAYGMDKFDEDEKNVLVFDLGGGTFDVTVLSIDGGIFQVLATNGDTHLGGSDFDQSVMSYYIGVIQQRSKIDIRDNKRALQKLRKEVERVKRALSTSFQARLDIEDLVSGYDFSETLTRAKFEELNAELFKKTLGPVKHVMEDAELDLDEIDEIILVGGSTRIPRVQALVSEYFDGKEPNAGVNPDEAVAQGAAIQGSILSGEGGEHVKDVMLLDVTPLSLGTSIEGGVMSVLIRRGTTIPTEKSSEFHTVKANQKRMTIDVYEGERSMVKDNHLLGEFELTDIPPGPRGSVKVLITYKIDANGILEVTAENRATRNVKKITITPESGRLSQDDIDRMVKEAERYAEEDERTRRRIEARNGFESFAYNLQGTLRENEERLLAKKEVGRAALQELMDEIDEALDWLERNQDVEKEEFDRRYSELDSMSKQIVSQLYASGASGGGEAEAGFDGDDEL